jgi:hypothetical protein
MTRFHKKTTILYNQIKSTMKIKTFRILILMLALIPAGLFAQDDKSVWLEAKVGLNSSWIVNQNAFGNREMGYSSSFTPTFSLGGSYFLTDDWGVNASLGYLRLGQNYSEALAMGEATRSVKLTYVSVPVLFMRNIPMTPNPTWIAFGPDFMFRTSAKQEFESSGEYSLTNDHLATGDIKERINPFDLALKFSFNKMYALRGTDNMKFMFSFNTAIGLLDVNTKDWQIPNVHNEYNGSHNFYMGLTAGIMFDSKGFKK